ncbi:LD-carboxypeptidase [Alcaligenes endophyticus]|uniref:LD-carboxypeptidase n=1 Tax=Alcaligenes endophyticus TaxID=1929088 RepID=A0ABT8EK30_9BURK|nr:LD-carboxypeptidase [Alcaligenes endophyticus]MCX5591968.1 LD-carboxypeptidase [Alcaligenes endophyticus]MDN4121658.1 LD-carboxypeptidase [Alcaligenes endophyticus]
MTEHHAHHHDEHHACSHCSPSGIYLFSPSGAIAEPERVRLACERLNALGFKTEVDVDALAVHQRFAGTDEQRLAAIDRSMRQPQDIVLATRGGYGISRLLHQVNWQALADSGKRYVGFSDFTAFSLALLAQTGAVSYSGPTAVAYFGADEPDELTTEMFGEAMRGELELFSFEAPDADPVDEHGVLWGGNLAMVVSLLGTPYFPQVNHGILFLEDVGEAPYRIERMLTQLLHAGVLARQKAILLGAFTEYRQSSDGYDLAVVVQWLRSHVNVPVICGLPYGHTDVMVTLPVGKQVGVATEDGLAYLVIDEHQH